MLFVHGRNNYNADTDGVFYYFYKNVNLTLPEFLFGFNCAFSGHTLFDDEYISFYNAVITTWPIAAKVLFDQDVNSKIDNQE